MNFTFVEKQNRKDFFESLHAEIKYLSENQRKIKRMNLDQSKIQQNRKILRVLFEILENHRLKPRSMESTLSQSQLESKMIGLYYVLEERIEYNK